MGNWNRHFVRIGSDGNVGIFNPYGDRFLYSTTGSDNLVNQIFLLTKSTSYSQNSPPNLGIALGATNGISSVLNPSNQLFIYGNNTLYLGNGAISFNNNAWGNYGGRAMFGIAGITGNPDLRTGITAADASAITIFSSTVSGIRYEVKARILATSGSSATYTISWTEGGVAQKVALTVTAVDTEVHDNFVIAPDANTNITAQITALTTSTVNVDAIVSVLG